ncbi:MAG: hypothetical protein IT386_12890 [Deltaproteobacteria bacterium]|nr:hypothetical protein [Deltaproteobacteria bacterium]
MGGDTRKRVLMLCAEPLLGDGLGAILGGLEDIELMGPLALDAQAVQHVRHFQPDLVLIAEDGGEASASTHFAGRLLGLCPEVPVIRVGLREDRIHLLVSSTVPARRTALIEAIRRLPLRNARGASPAARAPHPKR